MIVGVKVKKILKEWAVGIKNSLVGAGNKSY
jgi:hypothetical protein